MGPLPEFLAEIDDDCAMVVTFEGGHIVAPMDMEGWAVAYLDSGLNLKDHQLLSWQTAQMLEHLVDF